MCLFVKQRKVLVEERKWKVTKWLYTLRILSDKFKVEARREDWEGAVFLSLHSPFIRARKRLPSFPPGGRRWRCHYTLGILSDKLRVEVRWEERGELFLSSFSSLLREENALPHFGPGWGRSEWGRNVYGKIWIKPLKEADLQALFDAKRYHAKKTGKFEL